MRLSGNEIWEMPICLLSESLLWGCGVTPIYFCRAAVQGCIGCAQYRAPVLGGMWTWAWLGGGQQNRMGCLTGVVA